MSELDTILDVSFPLQPFPSMTLHEAVLADQTLSREIPEIEWQRAAELDKNRNWRSYSDDELVACELGLAHLTGDAFVYYIPAFISFASRYIEVEWSHRSWDLVGSVVYTLTSSSSYNQQRLSLLSPAQRQAAISFLELVAHSTTDNSVDAKLSLARYWSK